MAIRHEIALSTTEPNNEVGIIKIRQADEQTQMLNVQITENGVPKSYAGLEVYFCAKLGQTAGLGIIEQKLKPEEMTEPANGKLEYTMRAEDWQILGRQKGYFSFRKMKDEHEFIEQFTTRDFTFDVIKSVYSEGVAQVHKDGGIYIWTIEDMIRLFNEYMASGKSDWEGFVEQNRELIESVDPGGAVLDELIRTRKPEGATIAFKDVPERLDRQIGLNNDFREFETEESFMKRVKNEQSERGVNAIWQNAVSDCNFLSADSTYYADESLSTLSTDNTIALNLTADICRQKGYPFYLPSGKYLVSDTIDLRDIKNIKIEGEIIASKNMRNKSLVKIGSTTSLMIRDLDVKLSLSNEQYRGRDNKVVGLESINVIGSRIKLNKAFYFGVALLVVAEDIDKSGNEIGNAWNRYIFNNLQHNDVAIHLKNRDAKSYVNENVFDGSQCTGNNVAVQIGEDYNFEPFIHNHNTFYHGSFETNKIGFKFYHAHRNYVENARFEDTLLVAEFNKGSKFNFIHVGHQGNDNYNDLTIEKTNRVYRTEKIIDTALQTPSVSFKYATHINNNLIVPKSEFCLASNGQLYSFRPETGAGIVDVKGVKIPNTYAIGRHFTTVINKRLKFLLATADKVSADNKMFIVIKPYDSLGNLITVDSGDVSSVSQFGTPNGYWTQNFGGCYVISYSNDLAIRSNEIIFSDRVHAAFIGVSAGTGDPTKFNFVQGFSLLSDNNTTITTDYLKNAETVTFNEDVYYSSTPPTTGFWKRGHILYNTFFVDKTCVGWVCVDSGNVGTWKKFGILEQ